MRFRDYLQLLDWTGRRRRADKRGAIEQGLPSIFTRLQIDPEGWLRTMRTGGNFYGRAIGRFERLQSHAQRLGQRWIRGCTRREDYIGRSLTLGAWCACLICWR